MSDYASNAGSQDAAKSAHEQSLQNGDRYHVEYLPAEEIKPSPENDQLYGKTDATDISVMALRESIAERGLEEPLILTSDGFILSGHRRFVVCRLLGMTSIPCRVKRDIRRNGNPDYMRDLAAYNPQRVKSAGALLREAILRDSTTLEDTQDAIRRVRATYKPTGEPTYQQVNGFKDVEPISANRQEFLAAVQEVVTRLRPYWPLSIRQIHYQLLNAPPLKLTPKRSSFGAEKYRYRNDKASYDALSDLCTPARYQGAIPWAAIDDSTRTSERHSGYESVTEFIEAEMQGFLLGYHRDKQCDQPIHIEVLVEKNTLVNIIRPVCDDFYVQWTSGRGFAGPSVWRKIASRFEDSEKEEMVLLIVSDYDPEGFVLADDAIRSLRDLWEIPISYHRVAVTREQIDELGLASDFNPVKEGSPNVKNFMERTGDTLTWECEALNPAYLRDQLRAAIMANMNMEIFEANQEQEQEDTEEIHRVRTEIARGFGED
jgi:hypothetical protein